MSLKKLKFCVLFHSNHFFKIYGIFKVSKNFKIRTDNYIFIILKKELNSIFKKKIEIYC